MGTYYANLDLPGGEGATGSETNPFGASDFKNFLDTGSGTHTIYVKGKTTYSSSVTVGYYGLNTISLVPWGNSIYRIKISGACSFDLNNNSSILGAIIYLSDTNNNNVHLFSGKMLSSLVIIEGNREFITSGGNSVAVMGCTVLGKLNVSQPCEGIATLVDSVFIGPVEGGNATANRCCFTASSVLFSTTNCQFSWIRDELPPWDSSESNFYDSILSSGINSPPQPGNPPYTDYDKGLWNTTRTGIGACYFLEITTTTSAPTTTTPSPTTTPAPFLDNRLVNFGAGQGSRQVSINKNVSELLRRPYSTLADYHYSP